MTIELEPGDARPAAALTTRPPVLHPDDEEPPLDRHRLPGDTAEFNRRWMDAWSHELRQTERRRGPRRQRRTPPLAVAMALVCGLAAVGAWLSGPSGTRSGRRGQAAPAISAGPAAPHTPASDYALRTIPHAWLMLYWRAGAEYGLDWTVLAAVGTIESDNGQSVLPGVSSGTNYAGAAGPAQFESSTWARYGVNTTTRGSQSSPYDAADAITTMAAYLKASGAPQNWQTALYAYNHSDAYVAQVLALAARFRRSPGPRGR